MRDLPASLRNYLKQNFTIGHPVSSFVSRSSDGTRKLLIRLDDAEEIESVIIPTEKRVTLCMSSQVGCAMACEFCATARMGLHRNMTSSEMLSPDICRAPRAGGGRGAHELCFHGDGRAAGELSAAGADAGDHDFGLGDGHLAAANHRLDRRPGADDGAAAERDAGQSCGLVACDDQRTSRSARADQSSAIRWKCCSTRAAICRSNGGAGSRSST